MILRPSPTYNKIVFPCAGISVKDNEQPHIINRKTAFKNGQKFVREPKMSRLNSHLDSRMFYNDYLIFRTSVQSGFLRLRVIRAIASIVPALEKKNSLYNEYTLCDNR